VVLSTRATLARQGVHGLWHFLLDCSWLFPMEVSMSKKLLAQALEFLEDNQHLVADNERHAYVMEYNSFIEQLKEALAKQEQGWTPERIAGMVRLKDAQDKKLAQRTWVSLTDAQMRKICGSVATMREAVREAEAILKEGNI
jgi:hypothetical protein